MQRLVVQKLLSDSFHQSLAVLGFQQSLRPNQRVIDLALNEVVMLALRHLNFAVVHGD
ncbi:hypothetical protein D3C84_1293210 [compost metagenome]